jgi:hypothetical protein
VPGYVWWLPGRLATVEYNDKPAARTKDIP